MGQEEKELVKQIFIALIGNSARYHDMKYLADTKGYSNEQLTDKNINKAKIMAKQFLTHWAEIDPPKTD